ncbi:MAG: hypothetical protein IKE46_04055 [Selenomonadaceae bacterium]|nr:hypothetical protein [Selenomonadaceae bacterium]
MKKFFTVALMILFAAQICYAEPPQAMQRETAKSRARQSFNLCSVEGAWYEVYIVGEKEKIWVDWQWARNDEVFTANYHAYLGKDYSSSLALQNVELFGRYGKDNQRINMTSPNRDGFSVVRGVNGLPDLLVSKIQVTGGGGFEMKIFAVKNGQLRVVKSFVKDKKTLNESFITISTPTTYLDNGTISIPWHTNAMPGAGSYVTVYMFDVQNLILIPAYTNKIPRQ